MMKRDHKRSILSTILYSGIGLLMVVAGGPVFACSIHDDQGAVHNSHTALTASAPINQLRAHGVQVIHLGETYRLVIPSSHLFHPNTSHFHYGSRHILNTVARLLNAHHIITVKVTAYSDTMKAKVRKDALTIRQATAVQEYLSDHGLKARLIYGVGEGDKKPVASNSTWAGRYANRRVEIHFMYIPKNTIYSVRVKD